MNTIINKIDSFKDIELDGTLSLKDLVNKHPEFKGCYLCNEDDSVELTGTMMMMWDEFNSCAGLGFPEHDSFLNIYPTNNDMNDDGNFAEFNNSDKGFNMLTIAYNFFNNTK